MSIEELSRRLLYYKREDIRNAIVESCRGREVAIKYSDKFGKRPDILEYPNDVLDFVKKGATSFHVSEEIWDNPLDLDSSMSRSQLNELRKGWDLVLDIDCPYWEFSKLTTYLFVKALKKHGIMSISCKFSGNKGFHIGIPFRVLPEKIGTWDTKDWFPDGPRIIAAYLLDYISKNLVKEDAETITFDGKYIHRIPELAKELGMETENLSYQMRCMSCQTLMEVKAKTDYEYVCPKCEARSVFPEKQKFPICKKCGSIMSSYENVVTKCRKCGQSKFENVSSFNPFSVVKIDTILIASRHLYRTVYSLNEKSGLASIPISTESIMDFEKSMAAPEKVIVDKRLRFLDDTHASSNEAVQLVQMAEYFSTSNKIYEKKDSLKKDYEIPGTAVPAELFPPCIKKILEGLPDGRKRAVFILLNFLTMCGWEYDRIEELLTEWNKKNTEPLREINITGPIRYHKQSKKRMLPPNCRSYYQDFHVCYPDALCDKIKNPVSYSRRKSMYLNKSEKRGHRLTEEQREMRRRFRESRDKEKSER